MTTSLYFDEWVEDRTPTEVTWLCEECGETLRGEPNTQGQCGYCGEWQDAPDGSGLHMV